MKLDCISARGSIKGAGLPRPLERSRNLISMLLNYDLLRSIARSGGSGNGPGAGEICGVIGGLLGATVITKLQVPCMYAIFVMDLKILKWETKPGKTLTTETTSGQEAAV